ncbi:sugar kinase [Aurantiacibacter sp. MUD61]|uniref:sugar kinase n=1 Tax=Aurantiacibacter sp. MUD61 TaxID=3009083 RepID=UPI0022F078FB|nr:sugar kinase [Aurantiacibacter sp. MUD61]
MQGLIACFGEVLLRFAPRGGASLRDTHGLDLHVGGAEANVAVGLANLGLATRMITILPENDLGMLARKQLAAQGVDCSGIGSGAGRMGSYFATPAIGVRRGDVLYDRADSAFARFAADNFDPEAALEGARHLHLSGISLAVSETASSATRALAKAAKTRGLTLSVDGNYRPSLWEVAGRDPRPAIAELVAQADLFFGNHKDVSLLLNAEFPGDGEDRRRAAAEALLSEFRNLSTIASTARHVDEHGAHHLVGRIDMREAQAQSATRILANVVDRIGTGDAFAAGVLSGWLADPDNLSNAIERGMALAALKHYTPGDFSLATEAELRGAMEGAADVAR